MSPARLSFGALLLMEVCRAACGQSIYESRRFTVSGDRVREGKFEARAVSRTEIQSNYHTAATGGGTRRWRLEGDISAYPQLRSDRPLIDALYNLSLEELRKDVRRDGSFMAGAKWDGVWTRDISYSIVLALACIEPEIAKTSLLRKVARDRIVQDTGTGGSWPVSTDRMTWALAAWEVYLATGERGWLARAFEVIRNSAADDEQIVFSKQTGLVFGESSFLDWREQTYPKWMTPVDIYSSQALGTNAVHYRTYRILARMARLLGQPAEAYDKTADRLRDGINHDLWLERNGFYGQYLYGHTALSVSPRSEALGEALSILFDIASEKQQDRILQNVPAMEYGIPCIYPQTPGIPPYHNNAVWPFVQAFWNMAMAKRHNGPGLVQGIAAIDRAAALFLTNQENLVADSGSFEGTQINSTRQLWSVAGNLAMVYRVLLGMSFDTDGLRLNPVVPKEFRGTTSVENFKYRRATLKISVEGYGSKIRSAAMDGRPLEAALVSAGTEGAHTIKVVMADEELPRPGSRMVEAAVAPDTPLMNLDAAILHWSEPPGADHFVVMRNGERLEETKKTSVALPISSTYAEYQVSAVDKRGVHSFLSEPVAVFEDRSELTAEAESAAPPSALPLTGFTGKGFVELSRNLNRTLTFHLDVQDAGAYAIDFRYANGSGPINTDNKCGIRTLMVDGKIAGAIVLPQRGKDDWSNWGYSSRQRLTLAAGKHEFRVQFEAADENMNGDVNRAMLDQLRLIHIYNAPPNRF